MYQALTYLKSHNKFYKDISIKKGLYREDMFKFSDIVEIRDNTTFLMEKKWMKIKMTLEKSRSHSSVEDHLTMQETASNEITSVPKIPNTI